MATIEDILSYLNRNRVRLGSYAVALAIVLVIAYMLGIRSCAIDISETGGSGLADEKAELGTPGEIPRSTERLKCNDDVPSVPIRCTWVDDNGVAQASDRWITRIRIMQPSGDEVILRSRCEDEQRQALVTCSRWPPVSETLAGEDSYCYFAIIWHTDYQRRDLRCARSVP